MLDLAYLSAPGEALPQFPWSNTVVPAPIPQPTTYEIFRQPVRTAAQPLTFPQGIVIDLSVSGMGGTGGRSTHKRTLTGRACRSPRNGGAGADRALRPHDLLFV